MPARFADADLVGARAGASTVAELAAAGRPALLVPFPGAMDDHQTANARQLEAAGGAWLLCLAEAGLDAADLAVVMATSLLGDAACRRTMGLSGRDIAAPDAAKAIAEHAMTRAGLAPSDRRAA